jgi:hypothetical protein
MEPECTPYGSAGDLVAGGFQSGNPTGDKIAGAT